MRAWARAAAVVAALGALLTGGAGVSIAVGGQGDVAVFDLGGGDPRLDPAGFEVTVFATGLPYPTGMVELADGSLLVATSEPSEGSFFGSTGELRRLVDADGDGRADGAGVVVAGGLPGALTALARAGSLVYALSAAPGESRLMVLRLGAGAGDRLTLLGSIDFRQARPMQHATYAVAVREEPGAAGRHELFFNVGAAGNEAGGATVELSGMVAGRLVDSSIYRLAVEDDGTRPLVSAPELIASGLRNAAGIAVEPRTGDLWFGENGIDTPGNVIVALSADELNAIRAGAIGGRPEGFGFPTSYVEYASGETVGGEGEPPVVAFLPRDGDESEGAAQIALAPAVWPAPLGGAVVVGFHGQWDEVGRENEENPVLAFDPVGGEVVTIVGNEEPGIGHVDGLLATAEALYFSDLTGVGSLVGGEASGVIYRIVERG